MDINLRFTWMNKTQEEFKPIFEYAKKEEAIVKKENIFLEFEEGMCFPVKEYTFCLLWKNEEKNMIIEIKKSKINEDPEIFIEEIKEKTKAKIYCIEKDWYDNKVVGGFLDLIEEKDFNLMDEILEKIKTNNLYFLNEATAKWFKQTAEIKIRERRNFFLKKIKRISLFVISTCVVATVNAFAVKFIN